MSSMMEWEKLVWAPTPTKHHSEQEEGGSLSSTCHSESPEAGVAQ
jgi:hypothetical protein